MTISLLKKKAENSWKRINAQQYPAFIWTLSLRIWETQLLIIIIFFSCILNLWGFWNIFSLLCPHHLKTGLFQLSNHKQAGDAEKLWWWSSLQVSKIILFNLFEKAAEVSIFVFIKRQPLSLANSIQHLLCLEIQTYSSGWHEEQAQHLTPQPEMVSKNQLQVTTPFWQDRKVGSHLV